MTSPYFRNLVQKLSVQCDPCDVYESRAVPENDRGVTPPSRRVSRVGAKGRLSAPSLPDCATGRHVAEGTFGRFRPPSGSDGALRLGPPARRTPPRRGSPPAGPVAVRRPRDAPAALDGHPPHQRRAAGTFRPHRHHPAVGRRRADSVTGTDRDERKRCGSPTYHIYGVEFDDPLHETGVTPPRARHRRGAAPA